MESLSWVFLGFFFFLEINDRGSCGVLTMGKRR